MASHSITSQNLLLVKFNFLAKNIYFFLNETLGYPTVQFLDQEQAVKVPTFNQNQSAVL